MTPNIFIATPTPGVVKTPFMKAVIHTMQNLAEQGIKSSFETSEGSDVVHSRNRLASRFLSKPDCTHLFFADSDMMFPADLCFKLLRLDVPFVASVYSQKQMNLERFADYIRRGMSAKDAGLLSHEWLVWMRDENTVDAIGVGSSLIRRDVFELMASSGAAPLQDGATDYWNFFSARRIGVSHVSEDVAFCQRWTRDCGGTIIPYKEADIRHIGDHGYGGRYSDYLEAAKPI